LPVRRGPGAVHRHKLTFVGEGELAYCTVCGAGEGELLSSCPGYRLDAETLEACYRGNVKDFIAYKRKAEYAKTIFDME